jgi:hypothetical protein
MDRLSFYLTFATGPVLTGAVVITLFSMGLYNVWTIGAGVAAGLLLSWPAAYWVSRRIKRDDPNWDETKVEEYKSPVPKPGAPEV